MRQKTATIIGAGPAGLTAAYELVTRTDIQPIVLEKTDSIGGLSRTVNYKGNRMDIGGHRFFSKSDRVMDWWLQHLPMESNANQEVTLTYHRKTHAVRSSSTSAAAVAMAVEDPAPDTGKVMLVRRRKSRIYFLRKFFDYPIQLSQSTLMNLGAWRTLRMGFSYLISALFPRRVANNLEDFLINRFGRVLYLTFFKSYTEKVWGVPCQTISAEWGEQRIKGLSIRKAILHYLKKAGGTPKDVKQKKTETSLIEQFLYPKYGPGQMWEEVARKVEDRGGRVIRNMEITSLKTEGNRVVGVSATHGNGHTETFSGDYVFSTMPVKELVRNLDCPVAANVREVSEGLQYRDEGVLIFV
jgi:protoporphyrinogen oxidase